MEITRGPMLAAGAMALALASVVDSAHAVSVSLDPSTQSITAGGQFQLTVVLDADDGTAVADPLEFGLFSLGMRLEFDPAAVSIVQIDIPSGIDSDGFGGAAIQTPSSGAIAVEAFIPGLDAFTGTTLATITLQDAGTIPGYGIGLALFQFAPGADAFVDGMGNVLDNALTFNGAQINTSVVPVPAAVWLLTGGLGMIAGTRKRRLRS